MRIYPCHTAGPAEKRDLSRDAVSSNEGRTSWVPSEIGREAVNVEHDAWFVLRRCKHKFHSRRPRRTPV